MGLLDFFSIFHGFNTKKKKRHPHHQHYSLSIAAGVNHILYSTVNKIKWCGILYITYNLECKVEQYIVYYHTIVGHCGVYGIVGY